MAVRLDDAENVLGIIGLIACGIALYRLATGIERRGPAALPASPEDRVDVLVDVLNESFGKDWIHVRLASLKAALREVLPASMVALADFVHMIEDHSTDRGLSGATKRWWALEQAARAGIV